MTLPITRHVKITHCHAGTATDSAYERGGLFGVRLIHVDNAGVPPVTGQSQRDGPAPVTSALLVVGIINSFSCAIPASILICL